MKTRHRRAILAAARDLIVERGAHRFGVEELADRAGLSPRTIFNHFESLDDVAVTTCSEELSVIVSSFRSVVQDGIERGTEHGAFTDMVAAMRRTDIPAAISYIWRALGGFEPENPRQLQFVGAAFVRTQRAFATELLHSYPDADRLQMELLASVVVHGLAVVAGRWIEAADGVLDAESRRTWDTLFDQLVHTVETGFRVST